MTLRLKLKCFCAQLGGTELLHTGIGARARNTYLRGWQSRGSWVYVLERCGTLSWSLRSGTAAYR